MTTFLAAFAGGFVGYGCIFLCSWGILTYRERKRQQKWLAVRDRIMSALVDPPDNGIRTNAVPPKVGPAN